jgi:hypothetical protein
MRVWQSTKEKLEISGYANDIIHDRLTFGDNDGGTSTIQAKDFRVFINAVGENTTNISSGAAITQTEADTSLEGRGGTIPNGEAFVITAIGINLHLSNIQATQPFTNNADTSINVTPLYRVSPLPLHDAIMSLSTFELYRNSDERLERGNICEYPCEFGNFVAAGGAGASVPAVTTGPLQAAYTVNPLQYIESGGQRFRTLSVYQVLQSLDDFYGVFKVNREIALSATLLCGYIDFYLVGRLATQYGADQFVAQFAG